MIFGVQDGQAVLTVPELLYLPAGAATRIPLIIDPAAAKPGLEITYTLHDDRGNRILRERTLAPETVAPGVPPELIFLMPPYPFRGILTLTCGETKASCAVSCVQ